MKCPRCQHENPPQAKFCLECGARFALTCAACGTELPSEAKFCLECGHGVSARSPVQSRFMSPEAYTPKHLAEKILTSKSALEGERKQVTVLFADLKGSMELLADRDPEEARKLLDPVLERMMEAVHRYEGTVNQVMGDGIMALFGAPLAHEDHAVRACYAALAIQEAIQRYTEEVRHTHGIEVQVRVGLNSGDVIVRAVGSDLHMDYTAVGQTTHLAARMEQLAPPTSIRLTAETLRLAEGFVQVKPLGAVPIKGLAEAVEVFELVGGGLARTRWQAVVARGLTRFVGRQAELEVLRQALERARTGHGQLVAPLGEPGVGKSRLFWEFTHSHRTHGWLVLESGAVSYGKATPYLPVIDLLKGYFKIQDRDDQREIRDKVIGRLFGLDRALEPTLPAFLALLDVPVEDPQWQALDPPQRRQRTLDGIKRLLLRESQVQPLLVVVEDLHWIDSETQALLDSLIESLPAARIFMLVNYRPEYEHRWGIKTYYTQLRLDPLPPESADELLQALLGTDDSVQPLKPVLIERTEGNPFFLEESVRTLVETRVLVGERGAYRLGKPLDDIRVPTTVQAVLAARIDRLPPEDKRLLQAASVIGKDVPFALLQPIAELPEEALRQALTYLQASEFLYETSLFPELEYTFKHALTQEVAYGSLLQERRRSLHARIVEAIERLYADRLAEQLERLAHHAFRSEVWEQAVTYLRQAGAKAFTRSANREAVTYYEQAQAALQRVPETRASLEATIDLHFDLRHAKQVLGEIHEGIEHLREAEVHARALDDRRRLGQALAYMSWSTWMIGRSKEALTLGRNAQMIAETVEDLALTVVANYVIGSACLSSGDYPAAVSFHRRIIESLEGELGRQRLLPTGYPAAISRGWVAWALAERGRFDESIAEGEAGLHLAETLDHAFTLAWPCFGLANAHTLRGQFGDAVSLLNRAMALAHEWQLGVWRGYLLWSLGRAYVLSGRVAEGLSLLRESLDIYEARKLGNWESLVIAHQSEALLLAGLPDEALATGQRALALACERGERGHEAHARRILGEIAAHAERPGAESTEQHYRQALALATDLGMHPLVAHCHFGLGKLYRRTGDRPKAQEHLNIATGMLREMDMHFWLELAEGELKTLGSKSAKKTRKRR